MFANTLSGNTLRGLKQLGKEKILDQAYLAGGTALALRLGHRQSVDLDFFTNKKFTEKVIVQRLKELGHFEEKTVDWQTVMGNLFGVSFSLFYFEYPVLEPGDKFEGVTIASIKDIAAMKLGAIGSRGTKRDFVDMYFLVQELSLPVIFSAYGQKFHNLAEQQYHLQQSLNYFEDAEKEALPKMFKPVEWEEIKRFFTSEVKKLAKEAGLAG